AAELQVRLEGLLAVLDRLGVPAEVGAVPGDVAQGPGDGGLVSDRPGPFERAQGLGQRLFPTSLLAVRQADEELDPGLAKAVAGLTEVPERRVEMRHRLLVAATS